MTDMSSSIMTMSDFEESQVMESGVDGQDLMNKKKNKKKAKGCCINCWKMTTHTKVVP